MIWGISPLILPASLRLPENIYDHFLTLSREDKNSYIGQTVAQFCDYQTENDFTRKCNNMKELRLGGQNKPISELLVCFLNNFPNSDRYENTILAPAAQRALIDIFGDEVSLEDGKERMQRLANALVSNTSLNSYLVDICIEMYQDSEEAIPEPINDLICARAVEKAVAQELELGRSREDIKKTQVLRNLLFLPDVECFRKNKVQIEGERMRLPSLIPGYLDETFALIDKANAEQFVKMVCKTDPVKGKPIKKDGKYQFDEQKVNAIAADYFGKLGLSATKEAAVRTYEAEISNSFERYVSLGSSFVRQQRIDDPLIINEQIKEFKRQLYTVQDSQVADSLKNAVQNTQNFLDAYHAHHWNQHHIPTATAGIQTPLPSLSDVNKNLLTLAGLSQSPSRSLSGSTRSSIRTDTHLFPSAAPTSPRRATTISR